MNERDRKLLEVSEERLDEIVAEMHKRMDMTDAERKAYFLRLRAAKLRQESHHLENEAADLLEREGARNE